MPEMRYLMLHAARSGNSPESTATLELGLAHYPDSMRHVVVTCNAEGQLARQAEAHSDTVYHHRTDRPDRRGG